MTGDGILIKRPFSAFFSRNNYSCGVPERVAQLDIAVRSLTSDIRNHDCGVVKIVEDSQVNKWMLCIINFHIYAVEPTLLHYRVNHISEEGFNTTKLFMLMI